MKTFAILTTAVLLSSTVWAGGDGPEHPPEVSITKVVKVNNSPSAKSTSSVGDTISTSTSTSTSTVGDVGSVSSVGDIDNASKVGDIKPSQSLDVEGDFFFAQNMNMPMANGCWGTYQAGGTEGKRNDFLSVFAGLQVLNNDCFMTNIAQGESNAGVRARLVCASRKFRRAIAYEKMYSGEKVKRIDIQDHCVKHMSKVYVAEITWEKKVILEQIDAGRRVLRKEAEYETVGKPHPNPHT